VGSEEFDTNSESRIAISGMILPFYTFQSWSQKGWRRGEDESSVQMHCSLSLFSHFTMILVKQSFLCVCAALMSCNVSHSSLLLLLEEMSHSLKG
jgi:hypothetical protein